MTTINRLRYDISVCPKASDSFNLSDFSLSHMPFHLNNLKGDSLQGKFRGSSENIVSDSVATVYAVLLDPVLLRKPSSLIEQPHINDLKPSSSATSEIRNSI